MKLSGESAQGLARLLKLSRNSVSDMSAHVAETRAFIGDVAHGNDYYTLLRAMEYLLTAKETLEDAWWAMGRAQVLLETYASSAHAVGED